MYRIIDGPLEDIDLESSVRTEADGAVILFRGVARRFSRGRDVVHLEYEAYPEMAEKIMAQIGDEMKNRWPITNVAIVHRTGVLAIGQASVVIAVSAPHRGEAFAATAYAIDRLKQIVPIWKKKSGATARNGLAGKTNSTRSSVTRPVDNEKTDKTRAPLIFQARVNAAPQLVFDAFFREPTRWLCRAAHIDHRIGGELRMCWPDGCFVGHFVQWDDATTARFTWQMEGDSLPETLVVVRTAPAEGNRTDLEIEHYGFGIGPDWDMMYVGAARAWGSYVKNLRAVLEANLDLREADE